MTRALMVLAAAGMLLAPAEAKKRKDAVVVFTASDRAVVTTYYRGKGLPPGIEKQLRRNGRLPPGLAKKFTPFAPEVEMRLPPCPPDVRRGTVGGVAVMYNSRTGLIIDAFAVLP